ncbi:3'(2'),5'-bisphosphate nucleotidase CysQ [Alteribacillus sp. HJP-4]|uniref:3'(2'),5'-bisphosphate nucleotidase CysQ n=1 Tax=Alteribacillus sp. HJP-4 TaxID=2775394 RepID=UPI0035CD2C47
MLSVIQAAIDAGKMIMDVYETDFQVEYKEDESPLTIADKRAHLVIKEVLEAEYSEIPILSEEGEHLPYSERASWKEFWLVDPLDGTKEFIKKNDEFTVNIALIRDGKPVFGVIYAPALDMLYVGDESRGAIKIEEADGKYFTSLAEIFNTGVKLPEAGALINKVRVVASRSHMSEETSHFIKELENSAEVETVSAGSSLKLCLVAEGSADYYPRFAPTMEWDTGAGQAIVEAAGGKVTVAGEEKTLIYNKENLKNPWFLAVREP